MTDIVPKPRENARFWAVFLSRDTFLIPFFEVFIIEKDSLNNFKSFFHLQFSLYFQKIKNFCGRFSNTIFFDPIGRWNSRLSG